MKYTSTDVYETVRIRTPAYQLSSSTAKEMCEKDCTFKRVGNDKVVFLEYLGNDADVKVKVFSGKGPFDRLSIIYIVLCSVFIVFSGAGSVWLIYNTVQKNPTITQDEGPHVHNKCPNNNSKWDIATAATDWRCAYRTTGITGSVASAVVRVF